MGWGGDFNFRGENFSSHEKIIRKTLCRSSSTYSTEENMGVLRVTRSDLFSLGFCKRQFPLVQGSVRGEDGGGIWRISGGVREGDSDRGLAALAVLDVFGLDAALPIWRRSKDTSMRSNASAVGIGGLRLSEFRLKARVHSEGQKKAGTRSGSGWNRQIWMPDMVAAPPFESLTVCRLVTLTVSFDCLAGMRR